MNNKNRKLIEKGLEIDSNSITGKLLLLKTLSGKEIMDRIGEFSFFKGKSSRAQKIIAEKVLSIDTKLAFEFLDNNNPNHFLLLSQCFQIRGEFSDSILFANKFIQEFPRELSGFLNAGWISIEMDNLDEAIDYFDMALGIDYLCSEALYGKGIALKRKGEDFESCQTILSNIDKELII